DASSPGKCGDLARASGGFADKGQRPGGSASPAHSSGGNFAVGRALVLRDRGVPPPAAILSISPWYDIEIKNETVASNADTDKLLSRQLLESFRDAWLGGTGVRWQDPRVNMLYADLAGRPPPKVYYREDQQVPW